LFLLFGFRHGHSLLRAFHRREPVEQLTLWNGSVIVHPPGRTGLLETVLEVWCDRVYTRNFYTPRPNDVVVDAGANVGLFSIWLARRCPRARVFALEPFAENYATLEKNLAATRCGNVKPLHLALGATTGTGTMVSTTDRSLDHQFERSDRPDPDGIPVMSLEDFFTRHGIATIHFLKMDIEGSEYDVFSAVPDSILARIDRLGIEYHDNLRPGTLALLERRLCPTHDVRARSEYDREYGMLWAVRKR
jgi:FkbM family methyltransferase